QLYRAYHGFSSTLLIQNVEDSSATVSVAYASGATELARESRTIPAGATLAIDQGASALLPSGFVRGATSPSDRRLAGVVEVRTDDGTQVASVAAVASGSRQAYLPALYKSYYGYDSSVLVQNADATAATIELTYSGGPTRVATIPPGAS